MERLAQYGDSPEHGHYAEGEAGSRIEIFESAYRLVGFGGLNDKLALLEVELYLDHGVLGLIAKEPTGDVCYALLSEAEELAFDWFPEAQQMFNL